MFGGQIRTKGSALTAELKCNVKLFADDKLHFTIVQNSYAAASEMNHDIELISESAQDWTMSFNPDPQKASSRIDIFKEKS